MVLWRYIIVMKAINITEGLIQLIVAPPGVIPFCPEVKGMPSLSG